MNVQDVTDMLDLCDGEQEVRVALPWFGDVGIVTVDVEEDEDGAFPLIGIEHCEVEDDFVPEIYRAAKAMVDAPHVLQVRDDRSWGLQHPLRCRPALTECEVHRACMDLDGPPTDPGDYEIELHEADPVSESYRSGAAPIDILGPAGPDPALRLISALENARNE
jgi:hypothetical protein